MIDRYEYSIPKDAIGPRLIELAKKNERICVLSSDVSKSVNIEQFQRCFPDRFYEMGIAEQSTMSVAGGLAAEGFVPVYVALAIFSNGMTFSQMRQIANNNLSVKVIGTHAGVDDGEDGTGHHATEDMAISRAIPRMTVLCPSDQFEVAAAIEAMVKHSGPVYMRVAREEQPIIHKSDCTFEIGKVEVIFDEGNDFAIVFEGSVLKQSLQGWKAIKDTDKKGKFINVRSVKPLDIAYIRKLADMVDIIITVENHSVIGGLYSAVAETLAGEKHRAVVKSVSFHDMFTESGPSGGIKEKYGVNSREILHCLD